MKLLTGFGHGKTYHHRNGATNVLNYTFALLSDTNENGVLTKGAKALTQKIVTLHRKFLFCVSALPVAT